MSRNQLLYHRNRPSSWAGFPTTSKSLSSSSSSFGDATCMEQLLVHCATAIESNDATLAQQILWVLNNAAAPDGGSTQRLTSAFLRALVARAANTGSCQMLAAAMSAHDLSVRTHSFSVVDLASFVDLTPWHRFGFAAANAAILDAVEGFSAVHLVDLSATHCMQIPTLLDALAARPEGPPLLRLTVAGAEDRIPPLLDLPCEQLGARLVNFARSRNVGMEFEVVPSRASDGFALLVEQLRQERRTGDEALVINCQMKLRHVPDEYSSSSASSFRSGFLKQLRNLEPSVVILVEEDAELSSGDLVCRLRSAFNFLWIPYDTVDTFLRRGSKQRQWYEAEVGWKIENVIACEGRQRVERGEGKGRWVQRMQGAGFRSVAFGEDAVGEVRSMLEEHAAGWGFKKEEEDQHLVLTWKGHNVAFATAWVPSS
ncbi:Scarecrow-like protein 32 [Asimina triloba]